MISPKSRDSVRKTPITTIDLRDVIAAWSRAMAAAGVDEATARDRLVSVHALGTSLKSDPRWVTSAQLETYLGRLEPPARKSCYYSLATWFQYLCRVGWLPESPLDRLVVTGDFAAVALGSRDPSTSSGRGLNRHGRSPAA